MKFVDYSQLASFPKIIMTDDRKATSPTTALVLCHNMFKKQFPPLLQAITLRNARVERDQKSQTLSPIQGLCASHRRDLHVVWVSHVDSGFVGSGIGPAFPRRDSDTDSVGRRSTNKRRPQLISQLPLSIAGLSDYENETAGRFCFLRCLLVNALAT